MPTPIPAQEGVVGFERPHWVDSLKVDKEGTWQRALKGTKQDIVC